MIKIRNKADAPVPAVLSGKGAEATNKIIEEYNNGTRKFEFKTTIYGHDEVKDALINIQNGKCCFCEAMVTHVAHGDVEHYRPKGGWIQDNEKLNQPGYYWLAYNWDNLLFSCQICNQSHKKNFFPLADAASRATSHGADITKETPLIINPALDDPEQHIAFKDDIPVGLDQRGKVTISKTGLDREPLNENRRGVLNPIRQIYILAKGNVNVPLEFKQLAKEMIMEHYNNAQNDHTEYAAMLRCFFNNNPIDF